jgi:hypothetical protein
MRAIGVAASACFLSDALPHASPSVGGLGGFAFVAGFGFTTAFGAAFFTAGAAFAFAFAFAFTFAFAFAFAFTFAFAFAFTAGCLAFAVVAFGLGFGAALFALATGFFEDFFFFELAMQRNRSSNQNLHCPPTEISDRGIGQVDLERTMRTFETSRFSTETEASSGSTGVSTQVPDPGSWLPREAAGPTVEAICPPYLPVTI